jgi:AcrR family transcriptional regulator
LRFIRYVSIDKVGFGMMGRRRAFDTQDALSRAMDVFWRRGYEGASLAELTRAMGIRPPSLYMAFGNKDGLFRRALDVYAHRRDLFMDEVLAARTARGVAEHYLLGLVELMAGRDTPPGCLLVQGGLACGEAGEGVPQELALRRAGPEAALRARFERARAEGDLPAEADPSALTRFLSAVSSGMAVQAGAGATRESLREIAAVAMGAWPSGR